MKIRITNGNILLFQALKKLVVFATTLLVVNLAYANPVLNNVAAGNVAITHAGSTTTINQSSQKAIINWNSFNIGANESTHFQQPASGVALNRINPNQGASQIYGHLSATGQIILINGAGVHFGPGSMVNVGSLIVSTSNMSDENFLAGKYTFDQPSSMGGAVINEGTIRAASYGLVALLGSNVSNTGIIEARLGNVVLGSGSQFTLDFYGDQLVNFSVDAPTSQVALDQTGKAFTAGVSNTGSIIADGGRILVTAKVAQGVLDHVINMDGVAQAQSVSTQNGEIILSGGDNGTVNVTGSLNASSKDAGTTGGRVKIQGKNIHLANTANIDVSGDIGGGEILIGGKPQSSSLEQQALNTTVDAGAVLKANAINQGNGGNVIVWSQGSTKFYGSIFSQGGSISGNGGLVETSGLYLDVNGISINTLAAHGKTGTWLLDPTDIYIANNQSDATAAGMVTTDTSANNNNSGTFAGSGAIQDSLLTINTLVNALNTSDVLVTTSNTAGTGSGSIYLVDGLSWSANNLTLSADNQIFINKTINTTNGALTLNATNGIMLNTGSITTGGSQNYNNAVVLQNGGFINLTSSGGGINFASTIDGNAVLYLSSAQGSSMGAEVGGTTRLNNFLTVPTGVTDTINASILTTGIQVYNNPINVGNSNITLSTLTGSIQILSTLNGEANLTLYAPLGIYIMTNTPGATSNLGSLVFQNNGVGGTDTINGSISTTGTQVYNNYLNVNNDALFSSGSNGIFFNDSLEAYNSSNHSANNITINATNGNVTINGAVLATSLHVINPDGIAFINNSVTTANNQNYDDAVKIGSTVTLSSYNNGSVNFNSTIDSFINGPQTLNLNFAGGITLNGSVGGIATLNSLNITGHGGETDYINSSVNTVATQSYNNAIVLGSSNQFTSGNEINFNSALTSLYDLTLNSQNGVTLNGPTNVNSLTLSANAGASDRINNSITTVGNQSYANNVVLGQSFTLSSTSGDISFDAKIDGGANLILTTPSGNITLQGPVGSITRLASLTLNGNANLYDSISTTGSQIYNNAVLLHGTDQALSATTGGIQFAGTLDSNNATNLTLSAPAGITFDHSVGSSGILGSLTLQAHNGEIDSIVSDAVTTINNQTYNNAVYLMAPVSGLSTFTGNLIQFGSTIDGFTSTFGTYVNLILNGQGSFGGTVGGTGILGEIQANSIFINQSVYSNGSQTYTGDLSLSGNNITLSSLNQLNFNGAIDGPANLILNAPSGINFAGNIGSNSPLSSLILNANTDETDYVNGNSVSTYGNQIYNNALQFTQNQTLTSLGGSISFNSTLDGAHDLTLSAPGGVVFSGIVGGSQNLTGLTLISNTNEIDTLNTSSITTNGNQDYGNAIILGHDIALIANNGALNFGSSIDGPYALSMQTADGTTIDGAVGNITPLSSLAIYLYSQNHYNQDDHVNSSVITTDYQVYNNPVYLDASSTLLSSINSTITFNSDLDGASDLVLNAPLGVAMYNNYRFGIGLTAPLSSFTITAHQGEIDTFNANNISASGDIIFNNPLNIIAPYNIAYNIFTSSNGSIKFMSTLDGSSGIILSAAQGTYFNGAVGSQNYFGYLTLQGGGVDVIAANIHTDGQQSYGNSVLLNAANVTLTTDGNFNSTGNNLGSIQFLSSLNSSANIAGGVNLTINTPSNNVYLSDVGNINPLASLSILSNPSGSADILAGAITTIGNQNYSNPIMLGTTNVSASSTAGAINFASTIDGANNLALSAAQGVTLTGDVGTIQSLSSLTFIATPGEIDLLNNYTINTTGSQTYGNAVLLGGNKYLNASTINFASTVDSTTNNNFSLELYTPGGTTFGGIVGGITPLANLTLDANAGEVDHLTNSITTTGDQLYNNAVSLDGPNVALSAPTGSITFNSSIDGASNLEFNSPYNYIEALIGVSTPLTSLTFDTFANGSDTLHMSTDANVLNSITTTGQQIYNNGLTILNYDTVYTNNSSYANLNFNAGDILMPGNIFADFNAYNYLARINFNVSGDLSNLGGTSIVNAQIIKSGTGTLTFSTDNQYGTTAIVDGGILNITNSNAFGFGGPSGTGTPLLTVNSGGTAIINNIAFNVSAEESPYPAIILNDGATLVGKGNASITNTSEIISNPGGNITISLPSTTDTLLIEPSLQSYGNILISGLGTITFNRDIGTDSNINSLTVNANLNFNGTTIQTVNNQAYNAAVVLGSNTYFNSNNGAIAVNGSLDGNVDVSFNASLGVTLGTVGSNAALASLTLNSNPNEIDYLNGYSVTTTGSQLYGNAIQFNSSYTNQITLSTNGAINFNNTLDGPTYLTINAPGGVTINSDIGTISALNGLTLAANPGEVDSLNGHNILTTDIQNYNNPVVLGADQTLSSNNAINFASTLDGVFNLTLAGGITFSAPVGGIVPLASLNLANGYANINSNITTAGDQSYGGSVYFNSSDTLLASNSGVINFNGTVDGGTNLTLSAPGGVSFASDVGFQAPLGSLTIDAFGGETDHFTNQDGAQGGVITLGNQTYNNSILMDLGYNQFISYNGSIDFMSTIDQTSLPYDSTSIYASQQGVNSFSALNGVTFHSAVGSITPLGGIYFNQTNGEVDTIGANISTTGVQLYANPVLLSAPNITLTSYGTTSIGEGINPYSIYFTSSIDSRSDVIGGTNLVINPVNSNALLSAVGATNPLASLTLAQSQFINPNSYYVLGDALLGSINTIGNQIYNNAITIGTNYSYPGINVNVDPASIYTTLSSSSGSINMLSSIDGPSNLILSSPFGFTLGTGGSIGNNTPLASLTLAENVGEIDHLNGSIITSGVQIYNNPIILDTSTSLTSQNNGIQFMNTVDSLDQTAGLTSLTALGTNFHADVGSNSPLFNFTLQGSDSGPIVAAFFESNIFDNSGFNNNSVNLQTYTGAIDTISGNVTTANEQTYNDPLILNAANITLTANTNKSYDSPYAIQFLSTVESSTDLTGGSNLVLNGHGSVMFTGAGNNNPLASLTVMASGATDTFNLYDAVNGSAIRTIGDQIYNNDYIIGFSAPNFDSGYNSTTNNTLTFQGANVKLLGNGSLSPLSCTSDCPTIAIQTDVTGTDSVIHGQFDSLSLLKTGTGSLLLDSPTHSLGNLLGQVIDIEGGYVTMSNLSDVNADIIVGAGGQLELNNSSLTNSLNGITLNTNADSLNTLITTGSSTISNNQSLLILNGDVGFGGGGDLGLNITFNGNLIKSGTGSIALNGTDNQGAITINAGTANIDNPGALGADSVTINSGAALSLNNVSIDSKTFNLAGSGANGAGALLGTGNANITNSVIHLTADTKIGTLNANDNFLLGSTIDGNFSLSLNGPGSIVLGGQVGSVTPLTTVTSNVTQLSLANGLIKTQGNQIYNSAVVLQANTTLNSGSGALSINNGITDQNAGYNLLLSGGANNIFALSGSLAVHNITVAGGAGTNTLQVNTANPETWNVTANNSGNINGISEESGQFTFSSIQNVIGGNQSTNMFILNGGTISGFVTGGNSVNTLQANNVANTWNITGNNSGNVTGVGGFNNIQNLIGGNGDNNFILADNVSISGTIDTSQSTGVNSLNAEAYSTLLNVVLTTDHQGNLVNGSNVNLATFNNMENIYGNGSGAGTINDSSPNTLQILGPLQAIFSDPTYLQGFNNFINTNNNGPTQVTFVTNYSVTYNNNGSATVNGVPMTFTNMQMMGSFPPPVIVTQPVTVIPPVTVTPPANVATQPTTTSGNESSDSNSDNSKVTIANVINSGNGQNSQLNSGSGIISMEAEINNSIHSSFTVSISIVDMMDQLQQQDLQIFESDSFNSSCS
ncbi:MAG: filamentous hemagglutinin N-terminal domain-containing protein [Gammaproteobacteria bacterium]|nr:filamentous hemagglutinin N-terminal domain-containing protein [Gammaproteobacteria bacterium]